MKALTEVLIGLGLKLNASKTSGTQHVISSSLKADKRSWLRSRHGDRNIQKHLLILHAHGSDFPNTGSLTKALTQFHERLSKEKRISQPRALVSIAVDIAYNSPSAFPACAAIISKLLSALKSDTERVAIIKKIHAKLMQLPNIGHMEIWLQRISYSYAPKLQYKEPLCRLVIGDNQEKIWNNEWIIDATLKTVVNPAVIVDNAKLKSLKRVVKPKEIELFASERY